MSTSVSPTSISTVTEFRLNSVLFQRIIFDVSQSLDKVQAPPDAVKSTTTALVKVDSTFLPGTAIDATQWVTYAMTKGRVCVISRSSRDRSLLTLPPLFPPATAVCDMSVHSNHLAGVTSDGGLVVWELPEVITDDVEGRVMLCVYPQTNVSLSTLSNGTLTSLILLQSRQTRACNCSTLLM